MTVTASIVFSQNGSYGTGAFVANTSSPVGFANADDTDVVSWYWTMDSSPINSSVATGTLTTNSNGTFTPDAYGVCWSISLTVTDAYGNQETATSVVGVPDSILGWMIPAFNGSGDSHNFGGQTRGWAGTNNYKMLDSMLLTLTGIANGTIGVPLVIVPVTTLASPRVDGLFEQDGTHLYFTVGGTRYIVSLLEISTDVEN